MSALCLRLFGAFEITLDGREVVGLASDKVRALLAYLAIEADQPQRREKLAGLLWPDYPEAKAKSSLRTALANLRSAIGDRPVTHGRADFGAPLAAPPFLLVTRQVIQFNRAAGARVDVLSFTRLSAHADADSLQQAVALYRGDLLEGFSLCDAPIFEEWALLNRERYRRLVMDALRRLVDGYREGEQYEQALPHAWRQVELDPWQESAHQQLMWLLAKSGRRTDALLQYETCCRLLADELGLPPTEATVILHERIRSGELAAPDPAAIGPSRPAVQPVSLPEHRRAAGADRPLFVGRDAELSRLYHFLEEALAGQGHVVFVTGEAGSGKTALMAEFAHRAMDTHPHLVAAGGECRSYEGFGDSYLPFRGLLGMLCGDVSSSLPGGVTGIAHARRLREAVPVALEALVERGPQVLGTLVARESLLAEASVSVDHAAPWLARLRDWTDRPPASSELQDQSQLFQQTSNVLRHISRSRPLLLIVDDLQWADRASLGLLFHLGRRLQGSRILLLAAYRPEEIDLWQSGQRHPIQKLVAEFRRTYGDLSLDLDQLEVPTGRAFVHALLDSEPNRLSDDFRAALFERTEGHPLFTVELLRDMQESGRLRQDGNGNWTAGQALDWSTLPPRVEGVIEERLGRLDPELRHVLLVASVEGEVFTAQVIALALETGERRVLRHLSQQLARRHRLVRWSGTAHAGAQPLLRYRFTHALYRQYLYATLSTGERQILHRDIGASLEALHEGSTGAIAPQLAHHYSEAGDSQRALRYLTLAAASALAGYAFAEAETWTRRALGLALAGPNRAHLLEGLGQALVGQSRTTEALQVLREAISAYQDAGDLEGAARSFGRAADAALWADKVALGLRLCEEGLAAAAGQEECPGLARLFHESARAYYFHGAPERAETLCQRSLDMAERLGVVDVQADALVTLGAIPGKAPREAVALLARAAEMAEQANLLGIAFRAHNNLALAKAPVYGLPAALGELQRAIEISLRTGNVHQEIRARANLLEVHLEVGDLKQAQEGLARIRRLAAELDDPQSSADRIRRLSAAVLLYQGEWPRAISMLRVSQAANRQRNDLFPLLTTDLYLACALLEAGTLGHGPNPHDWDDLERAVGEAIHLGEVLGERDGSVGGRACLARACAAQGQIERARELLAEVRASALDWSFSQLQTSPGWAEAALAAAEGRWAEAFTRYEALAETYTQQGLRWALARTLIDWAAVCASRPEAADFGQARSLLRESEDMWREMGIPRYAEKARERLSALADQG